MGRHNWRKVPGWDCKDGTPGEDHDWRLVPGDTSVGEGDYMVCNQCEKERIATEEESRDSYCDEDF